MRICVVSTPIFKLGPTGTVGYAGLEQLAWLQAKGLAAKGHQVSLVAPDGSECPGVTIIPIGEERKVNEEMAYQKYWEHLLSVDCVIDNSWNKWSYILKVEGRLKAPILGVLHAPCNTMYQSLPPIDKPCFVCISRDQALHFEGLFGREARTAYNGIDLQVYKPLNLKRSDRFLFLARFSSVKSPDLNEDICIQAGVGLDLVGDTSITNEPEYLEKCKQKADGKQIKIIGGIPRGETVWWYSQARGFIHCCPNFREPFGLAPIEANACGVPVLAWRYGAVKETILDGKTGYLVTSLEQAVDKIESGAMDVIDREACIENAQRFSVENMINRYNDLVQEAVEIGW